MASIAIIPSLSYVSIDGDARRVDCSSLNPTVARLCFDGSVSTGWTTPAPDDPLDLDQRTIPISVLSPEAQTIVAAWSTAPAF